MSLKYRWLIVNVDAEVSGTNDAQLTAKASLDGESVTIDLQELNYTFDGDQADIEEAKAPEEDDEDGDEDDGEEDDE